jgi:hypothetical protein
VLSGAPARADEGYRHGRVRFVEPGVTFQRANDASAEEALANQPFLPGDRIWTDGYGRVEFQFPDGTMVRLDSRSKLDYSGHEEGRAPRIVLRLWSGSVIVRVRTRDAGRFEVETPAGTVEALDQAMVRVDVDGGEARVSAYRGEAMLDDGHRRLRIGEGERTFARWGGEAEEPRSFDVREDDEFSRWDEDRDAEDDRAARSSEYLPHELDPYAGEFENNGSWRYEAEVGYVWSPRVGMGWSPYSNGQWSWTAYGWTWIPNEPWGWAPFHYGRWGFSAGLGWYWAPGHVWGPGWVSWGVGNGYVGWCPLGWRDKPVYAWGDWNSRNRGFAEPRRGTYGSWMVVRGSDFGRTDLAHHRVPLTGIDPGALRVADSPNLRPTRDVRALAASNPEARAISRRPSPGDFVRELSVDNKTTIPATWLHARPRRDEGSDSRQRDAREAAPSGARARRDAGADGRAASGGGTAAPQAAVPQEPRAAEPRRSRSVPWYTPPARDDGARAAPSGRDDSSASRNASPRRDDARAERPPRQESERRPESGRPSYRREAPRNDEPAQPRDSRPRDSYRGRDEGSRSRPEAAAPRPQREPDSPRAGRSDGGQSRGGGQPHGGGGQPKSDHAQPQSHGDGGSSRGGESRGNGGHGSARPRGSN